MKTTRSLVLRLILFAMAACGFGTHLTAQVVTTPFIITQPASQTVPVGSSVTFSVVAGGSTPLSYQWRRGNGDIVGQTGASLTLTNVPVSNPPLTYSVVVINSAGSVVSASATLNVTQPTLVVPTIVSVIALPGTTVGLGANVTITASATGSGPLNFQWRKDGRTIGGANAASLILPAVTAVDAANYSVVVSNAAGSVTSEPLALTVIPPVVVSIRQTPAGAVAIGSNVAFTAVAAGSGPYSFQWSKDGSRITGATNSVLQLTAVVVSDAGTYAVTATNPVSSAAASVLLEIGGSGSRIVNLSVRTAAGAGDDTLTVGFVISGQGPAKPMLLRGIGPALAAFQVPGFLVDPTLTLFRGTVQLASNDNWGDGLASEAVSAAMLKVGAFPLGSRSLDAALLASLQPSPYTAQVAPRLGTANGIALFELYDADEPRQPTRLINVSARAKVESGAGVLIAGFVIQGNAPMRVLIRGIGPTLAAFGVTGVLANPQIVLNQGGAVIGSNDDWWRESGSQSLPAVFATAGAFSLVVGTSDAAMVATLQPGSYTVTVSSANGGTGVALVEIYEVL